MDKKHISQGILATATLALAVQQASAELLISEYVEGSSFNKAIELTNVGSETIDLSGYQINLFSNGNSASNATMDLTGSVEPGAAFVVAHKSSAAEILAVTNQVDDPTSAINFNGDDALTLTKDGNVIDSIGQVGVDPGSRWEANGVSTQNNTIRRKDGVTSGDANPTDAFDPSVEWDAFGNNNFDDLGNGGTTEPPEPDMGACADPATLISAIQGSGAESPLAGEVHEVEGLVTAVYQGNNQIGGFFLQEEDVDSDGDSATSEGIYVYSTEAVSVGDLVRLKGEVKEHYSLTEITSVTNLEICSSGNTLPAAVSAYLPLASADALENVEGMLVEFPETLTVNETYNLGRYGEIVLSNGRRYQGTEVALPGADAVAINEANLLNQIVLNDGFRNQNPDPIIIPAPELSAANTVRSGYTIGGLTGVMNFSYGQYKLEPVGDVTFDPTNARTVAPEVDAEADLVIASYNVLNFFNGDGLGGGFPTPRGADDQAEYDRQLAKLVSAINTINADIVGLMEIENDGFDDLSAIAALVNALNVEQPAGSEYAFVNPGVAQIGTDAIAVGLIYRPSVVGLTGTTAILDSSNSPLDPDTNEPLFNDGKNRPALTQSFEHLASGEVFGVVVNHFKSKGSSCDSLGDPDLNDGQGNCNLTRTNAAKALNLWLDSNPTGVADDDWLVMGDLNAYSMEDPIREFTDDGWVNLKHTKGEEGDYSYIFNGQSGNLDHALATASFDAKTTQATDWHINTDEPRALDYNLEYKSDAQDVSLYAPDAYRSSDHDPVIISMVFNQAPVADFDIYNFWGWYLFVSNSYDPDGWVMSHEFDFGNGNLWANGWAVVPGWYFHWNGIDSVSLTVTDDEGASTTVTKSLY